MQLVWRQKITHNEQDKEISKNNHTTYYHLNDTNKVNYLNSKGKFGEKKVKQRVDWATWNTKYFSMGIILDTPALTSKFFSNPLPMGINRSA